jgi:ribonuclease VapC
MVVDTSAVMAILRGESEASVFAELIENELVRIISAVSVLEAGIVTRTKAGIEGARELDALIAAAKLEVIAFDGEQAMIAREAFERFGKGRHRAALNFGDCAAYALAMSRGEPLLFKGNDFAATDVVAAVAR